MVSASVIGIETVGVAQLKDTARQLIEKATRFVQYIGYRYKKYPSDNERDFTH